MTMILEDLKLKFDEPIKEEELRSPGLTLMNMMAKDKTPMTKNRKKLNNAFKRLEPGEDVKCHVVSLRYSNDHLPPQDKRDMLKWPIPDINGKHSMDICFFVREVQDFLVANDNVLDGETEPKCLMFARDQIQALFNASKLEYVVPVLMEPEFRSVFIEYDLMPSNVTLKEDPVTTIVIQKLEEFINGTSKEVEDDDVSKITAQIPNKESKLMKVVGFFWYATKKSISFLKYVTPKVAKFALWIVKNPTYLRIALIVARVIRIALCIKTSFPNMSEQILNAMIDRLQELAFGYGVVIWEFAKRVVKCATTAYNIVTGEMSNAAWDAISCGAAIPFGVWDSIKHILPDRLKNFLSYGFNYFSNTLWNIGQFISSSLGPIFESIGLPVMSNLFRVMTAAEAEGSDILGLGKNVTTLANLRLGFQSWTPDYLNVNTVMTILDIIVTVIDIVRVPNSTIDFFAKTIIARIPVIGPLIAQSLKIVVNNTVGLFGVALNPIRMVLVYLQRAYAIYSIRTLIIESLHEIYEWYTDLFPCLFKFVSDKLLSWITGGFFSNVFVKEGDKISKQLEPTCCLTPIIRQIQRQFVFGELDRQNNIKAQDLKHRRSEVGWWDYLSSGEATTQILQEEQKLRETRADLKSAMMKQGGVIKTSYTTRSLGDTLGDIMSTKPALIAPQIMAAADRPGGKAFVLNNSLNRVRRYGATETMTVVRNVVGLPCVHDDYLEKTKLPGAVLDVPFKNGTIRFYLMIDGDDVYWHLARNDMMSQFPNHIVYGDPDKQNVILPVDLFSQKEQVKKKQLIQRKTKKKIKINQPVFFLLSSLQQHQKKNTKIPFCVWWRRKKKKKTMECLDRYCAAQDRSQKWSGCLTMVHTVRKLILASTKQQTDRLEDALVQFDLLNNFSRSDIHGATVWLARDRETGRFLVVKQYAHANDEWDLPQSALRQLYCSCRLLQSQIDDGCVHRCLQQILDLQISALMTYIVFPYYPLMLEKVFPEHMHQDPNFKLSVVNELILAVQTMHDVGIAHRDIKVQNIALDTHSRVVLIDFDSGTQREVSKQDMLRHTRPVCTIFTRPPEHFEESKTGSEPYDAIAGDWWSTGCVIAQLFLVGQILFEVKSNSFHSEFVADIRQFCAEFDRCYLANCTSSTNTRVKSLMRASMSPSLRGLLHGLLSLDGKTRVSAAHTYLEQLKIRSPRT